MRNLVIFLIIIFSFNLYSQDTNSDIDSEVSDESTITEENLIEGGEEVEEENDSIDRDTDDKKVLEDSIFTKSEFNEEINRTPVVFEVGGLLGIKSRLLMGDNGRFASQTVDAFQFEPVDKWDFIPEVSLWARMSFTRERFLHVRIRGLFLFNNNGIVPAFNIDELYLSWQYDMGRLVLGRALFSMHSSMIFSGYLDGIELSINSSFLDFKSFIGYSGLQGIFHPHFNPYAITEFDRGFVEQTDLTNLIMVVQLNGQQSRRLFINTDFDFHFFGQHIVPYLLLQFDLSGIEVPGFSNDQFAVNTFHIGLDTRGRIAPNFYYKFEIVGAFGTNQDMSTLASLPVVSMALITNLRYTIPKANKVTFVLEYAMGTGTPLDETGFWDDDQTDKDQINKFYYFGKYNGGFALQPVLSNLHILSFQFLIHPHEAFQMYASYFQTIKMYPESPISDVKADKNEYIVGGEIDFGMNILISQVFSLNFDTGLFIPMSAYTDTTPRLRLGAGISFAF